MDLYFSKGLRAIWLGSEVGFCFWNWKVMHFNILIGLDLLEHLLMIEMQTTVDWRCRSGYWWEEVIVATLKLHSPPVLLPLINFEIKGSFFNNKSFLFCCVFVNFLCRLEVPNPTAQSCVIHYMWALEVYLFGKGKVSSLPFWFTNFRKNAKRWHSCPEQHLDLKEWGKNVGKLRQDHITGKRESINHD